MTDVKEASVRGMKRGREPPPQKEGLCHFWVKKKCRYCRWPACASDPKHCANHSMADRIPCPLDPNHTVFKSKLQQHLKVCNKTKLAESQQRLPCYRQDANTSAAGDVAPEKTRLVDFAENEVLAVIEKVKKAVREAGSDLEVARLAKDESKDSKGSADAEQGAANAPIDYVDQARSKKKLKHEVQQEGILDLLERVGYSHGESYANGSCFVEMGASKGGLSMALYDRVPKDKSVSHVLVDRAAVKLKKDRKLEKIENNWQRLRIDIRHLKLQNIEKVKAAQQVVILSKHLCGAATCYTLRCCCADQSKLPRLICIALCCHQVCDYEAYPHKMFLERNNISMAEFTCIRLLSSWANCGWEKRKAVDNTKALSSLSVEDKEQIGRICKRFLDLGRVRFLQDNGYHVSLHEYVDASISPENIVLFGRLKTS